MSNAHDDEERPPMITNNFPGKRIVDRQKRIRLAIIKDLIALDLLTCRPISHKRDTAELAAQTTRKMAVAQHETVTMATEHAQ